MSLSSDVLLELDPNLLFVPQGQHSATARLRLANAGTIVDQYTLQVEGLDPTWWRLSNDSPSLFPGDQTTLTLEVHTPVAQAAGRYPFRVVATSVSVPSRQATAEGAIMIEGKAGARSRLRPERARGRRGHFRIETENVGTQPLEMTYSGYDTEDRCRLSFSPRELAIPPRQTATAKLDVRARRNSWFGKPYSFKLRLSAVPKGHSDLRQALAGEFEHKPLFRSVLPFILLLLLITALAASITVVTVVGPERIVDYFHDEFFQGGGGQPPEDETPGPPPDDTPEPPEDDTPEPPEDEGEGLSGRAVFRHRCEGVGPEPWVTERTGCELPQAFDVILLTLEMSRKA